MGELWVGGPYGRIAFSRGPLSREALGMGALIRRASSSFS